MRVVKCNCEVWKTVEMNWTVTQTGFYGSQETVSESDETGISEGHKDRVVQTFSDQWFNSDLDKSYVEVFVTRFPVSFYGCRGQQITGFIFLVNAVCLFYSPNMVVRSKRLFQGP